MDEKLSSETKAIYTQIVGAYDKATETQSDGILRAQDISKKLDASGIKILKNSSTTLSVSNGIPKNRFVLKITFATDVGVASTP
jgi:hypothetical protein